MLKKLVERICPSGVVIAFMFGIIGGIVFSLVFRVAFFDSWLWVVFVILVTIFAVIKPNYLFVVVMLVIGAVLGATRVSGELKGQEAFRKIVGETVTISGEIKGDPDFQEGYYKIKLKNIMMNGENIRGVIYVSGRSKNEIRRNDRLTISGKMAEGFGVYAGSFFDPNIVELKRPEKESVLLKFREKFAGAVKGAFSENSENPEENVKAPGEREANLGLSYLLGMRNGLDSELTEILSMVGLTHIVVASGTHLGILVETFRKVFGRISRFAGMYFGILFIVLFGEMIGWTASITRAGIVAILGILGWYVGRKFEAWRIILIAMATTLLIEPMNVVDLGWLLSFGAFIGIMVVGPMVTEFFYGKWGERRETSERGPGVVAEIVIATISATLMCAPILLYFFGSLSLISVVANLLILPTIPVAMGLTFLTGLIGFFPFSGRGSIIFKIIRLPVVKITTILLKYHIAVMTFFSKQTGFIIQIPKNNPKVFLLYIPILAPFVFGSFVRARNKQKQMKLIQKYPERYIRLTRDR